MIKETKLRIALLKIFCVQIQFMSSQEKIMNAIVELDELNALELAAQMVDSGIDPVEILEQCRKGMSIVGEKFESCDFFFSEMIMAAEIFNQVMRARTLAYDYLLKWI